jgi:hypothetical protein
MIGRLTFRTAAAALSAILALQSPSARCGQALDWHAPWLQPADPQAAQILSDEYAWRLFVALNWPADPVTRAADPAVRLGADRPVVWETWKSAGEVYLAGGVDPGAWDAPSGDAALRSARRFEVPSDKDFANARHIVNGAMVPLSDPLEGARRLTEIRLNRATFEFIRLRHLYSIEGQLRNYAANLAVVFPTGAREIKAKWRPIQPQERARYHTVEVQLADGSRRLYGLTALHILSKDLPTWFWATFEHPGALGSKAPRGPTTDCAARLPPTSMRKAIHSGSPTRSLRLDFSPAPPASPVTRAPRWQRSVRRRSACRFLIPPATLPHLLPAADSWDCQRPRGTRPQQWPGRIGRDSRDWITCGPCRWPNPSASCCHRPHRALRECKAPTRCRPPFTD